MQFWTASHFCGLPRAVEQLYLAEILYCQAAPVIRCTSGLETAFAVATILVAQHLEPSISVPAQHVGTEQPSASAVECSDRSPGNNRCPYLGMNWFQCAGGNRHRSQDIALPEAVDSQCRRLGSASPSQNIFVVLCRFSLALYFGTRYLSFYRMKDKSRPAYRLPQATPPANARPFHRLAGFLIEPHGALQ